MKILKKSKSKNTKMDNMWLDSAGIKHFWIKWRFEFLLKQLKKNNISINKKLKIMDLGCGNGILSNQLESKFNIKIDRIDANEETLLLNKKIKGKLICYNINTRSKKIKNYYDVIFLFDVLEHIKKDVNFLKSALFHLKKKGFLIINVPSVSILFSNYDYAVGHLRRYNFSDFEIIRKKLKVNARSIQYWGTLMLPILIIRKIVLSFYNKKNFKKIIEKGWKTNKFLNCIFKLIMSFEIKFFNNSSIGTSLMVIFKK